MIVCCEAAPDFDDAKKTQSAQLYGQIERVIADTAKQTRGDFMDSGRWQEIQGAWVLQPSKQNPVAIVHFIGGVFVGATPQLTYRLFLERLCERGFIVIATPFASGFDHLRIADETQFKFDRCIRSLRDDLVNQHSTFGPSVSLSCLTLSCLSLVPFWQTLSRLLFNYWPPLSEAYEVSRGVMAAGHCHS
jgi:hypothetical protein